MICVFVLDNLLTSWIFTTRTEPLTKCVNPAEDKGEDRRTRHCKNRFKPPPLPSNLILLIVPRLYMWYYLFCILSFSKF